MIMTIIINPRHVIFFFNILKLSDNNKIYDSPITIVALTSSSCGQKLMKTHIPFY